MDTATMLTIIQPPSFSPTSSLTLSWGSTADVLVAYYTGTDNNIYQLVGRSASTLNFATAISSNSTGRTTPGWTNTAVPVAKDGGGVVSIGFDDQIMVFGEMGAGREVEMSSLNTTSGVFLPGVAI